MSTEPERRAGDRRRREILPRVATPDRSLFLGIVALAVALLILIGLAAFGLWKAENDASELKAVVRDQQAAISSPTHGKDIAVWCNAINKDRTYNRAFVARVTHGQVVYTLGDLNCAALESAEKASTKPHAARKP